MKNIKKSCMHLVQGFMNRLFDLIAVTCDFFNKHEIKILLKSHILLTATYIFLRIFVIDVW